MRLRPVVIAACGVLVVLGAAGLPRHPASGTGWLARWLPWSWYDSFAHVPCSIPVHYVLDEVDPGFGFDRLTVMTALVEAAGLWQSTADALLFIESDHPQAMRVNLLFDERQQAANLRRSLRGGLDRDRRQLEDEEAALLRWSARIESARRAHEEAGEALRRQVRSHEDEASAWNAGQGARTEARRLALETESALLREALAELERGARALNADIAAYNRRASDLQQQAEAFRARVARYYQVSPVVPVESGRYSYDRADGRRIEVFRAEHYDELVWVLAHELGHALGLGHVAAPDAIMHDTLHDAGGLLAGRARPVALSAADQAALAAVCGQRLH